MYCTDTFVCIAYQTRHRSINLWLRSIYLIEESILNNFCSNWEAKILWNVIYFIHLLWFEIFRDCHFVDYDENKVKVRNGKRILFSPYFASNLPRKVRVCNENNDNWLISLHILTVYNINYGLYLAMLK